MPARQERNDRIRQDVTDISSANQLLRYATAGQLEPLLRREGSPRARSPRQPGLGSTTRNAGPVLTSRPEERPRCRAAAGAG